MTERMFNCTIDGQTHAMRAPDHATAAERIVAKLELRRTQTRVNVMDKRSGESANYTVHCANNPSYTAVRIRERTTAELDERRY